MKYTNAQPIWWRKVNRQSLNNRKWTQSKKNLRVQYMIISNHVDFNNFIIITRNETSLSAKKHN